MFGDDKIDKVENEFFKFIANHNKFYSTRQEYNMRLDLFTQSHQKVEEINSNDYTWKATINQFSDLTTEEKKKMLGFIPSSRK